MTGSARRLFGMQPRIDDGLRGDALVLQSVAGEDFGGHEQIQAGGFSRWLAGVSLLVQIPGHEPYELTPRLWMSRAKYPIAGTTLPVTADANDLSSLKIEWDEVPAIDEWIAAGHPVFTHPDSVQAQLAQALAAHRQGARDATVHEAVEQAATIGPEGGFDRGVLHQVVDQLLTPIEPQTPARSTPLANDSSSGRILAASPAPFGDPGTTRGEVLLSIALPGRPRYGARWHGFIPPTKSLAQWSDVPVTVDPQRPDRVKIVWDGVPDGIAVATDRLQAANARLEAQLAAGPQNDMNLLIAAIPDPAQRALVEQQIAQATGVAPPAAAPDPIAQLERLAALRDSGALTEAEFAAEKARVLDQT